MIKSFLSKFQRILGTGISRGDYRYPSGSYDDAIIELQNVSKRFGSVVALENLNWTAKSGQVHGVTGPNGSGKTTLFEIILRLRHPTTGIVVAPPSANMGYAFQQPQFYPALTVAENITAFSKFSAPVSDTWRTQVVESLQLREVMGRKAGKLSGGFQQKLDIGLALIGHPDVLILDEPFADVDEPSRDRIIDLVSEYVGDSRTVLVSSHNQELISPIIDTELQLIDGRARSE